MFAKLRVLSLVCLLLLLSNFATPPKKAHAEEPFAVENNITDFKNVLSENRNEIQDLIKKIRSETGQNIWIIFVTSFTDENKDMNEDGKIDNYDWVKDVAVKSNMGDNDVILAVATIKHEVVVYTSANNKYLKQKNVNSISNATLNSLRSGDWALAAKTFCESVEKQIDSRPNVLGYLTVLLIVIILILFLIRSSQNNLGMPAQEKVSLFNRIFRRKSKNKRVQYSFSTVDQNYTVFEENYNDPYLQNSADGYLDDQYNNYANNSFGQYDSEYNTDSYRDFNNIYDFNSSTSNLQLDNNSTSNLYGDYYQQSYSRELYGSYYNEGELSQHDEMINEANYDNYNGNQTANIYDEYLAQKPEYQSNSENDIYGSYYNDNDDQSFLKRFNR